MTEPDGGPYREAIAGAFVAVGRPLEARALDRLCRWAALLAVWNRRINLTRITAPRDVAERHLLDSSLVALDPVDGEHVADVGSGPGLPGLPVAVLRPEVRVTLVERVAKKVAFLRAAVDALELSNVTVERMDLGALSGRGFDRAVSRALAAPADWIRLARPIVRPGGAIGVMVASASDLPGDLKPETTRHLVLPSDGTPRTLAWYRAAG